MTGTIKIINGITPEMLDALEGEIEPTPSTIYFNIEDVKSFYIVAEEEEKFLYTNIGGHEYPLVHEDILEAAFRNKFEPKQSANISA